MLYDEDISHINAMEFIKKNYDYACIFHDKDIKEDTGEIKKGHYHYVIKFNNAKWNTAIADELGITPNYIENCRNIKNSLLYLIHYNDIDKYQYNIDEVSGSLKKKLIEILNNGEKTENEKMQEIIDYIDNERGNINYASFIKVFVALGYTDIIRRDWSLIKCLLDDHNGVYSKQEITS